MTRDVNGKVGGITPENQKTNLARCTYFFVRFLKMALSAKVGF
jgi:hypothetical protein